MNKFARYWVLKNCRFAQVQLQDQAQRAAEQKHIQSVDAMNVQELDSDSEPLYGDDPSAFEPGTVPSGSESVWKKVLVQGKVFWTAALEQYYGINLEESIRTTLQDAPPPALEQMINSGDKVEISDLAIRPSEPDLFIVQAIIEISGEHRIEPDYPEYDDTI